MRRVLSFVNTYFAFCVWFFTLEKGYSQIWEVHGQVQEFYSNEPLPFASISINDGEINGFADIEGKFSIEHGSPIHTIQVDNPLHRAYKKKLMSVDLLDSLQITLVRNKVFEYVIDKDSFAYELMKKVIKAKKQHNPEIGGQFEYKSYNKFYLTSERAEITRNKLNKLSGQLEKLRFLGDQFHNLSDEHHLFMMESITERKFHTNLSQRETVKASRVTGIEHSTFFTATSLLQPFSIYQDYVHLAGKKHYSPFLGHAFAWYRFRVVDSVEVAGGLIYIVQFSPKSIRKIEFLKGFLYINSKDNSVLYVNASPSIPGKVNIELFQSYQKTHDGRWFPYRTVSRIIKDKYASTATKFEAVNESTLFDIRTNDSLRLWDFNEVFMDFRHEEVENRPIDYWEKHRQQPLSAKDKKTYHLYDSIGYYPHFERLIRFGEGLYYGEIPFKWVNMHLYDVYRINEHEGFRLGLGLHTNEKISEWWGIGGHVAYGTLDGQWKYLFRTHVDLAKQPLIRLNFRQSEEEYEAGNTTFYESQRQFSTETLRNVLLQKMDRVITNEVSVEGKYLLRYLSAKLSFAREEVMPQYSYRFRETDTDLFRFSEFRLRFKYAFGQHFLQSLHKRIPLPNHRPILWLQWTKGLNDQFGTFDYHKWDFRIQQTFDIASIGTTNYRIEGGLIRGGLPYPKLYNGKGSFREFSAITHNAFETMDYNEFLSDRYISFFFTHDFGEMYIRKLKSQPYFQLIHNIGWGTLENPSEHAFDFKTMERGFFEAGLYLNNLLVVKMLGFELGMGVGAFRRYGHYSHDNVHDNVLFKFAVKAKL